MLLYVESKAFPYRTFVVRVQSFENIARVRAQLLHVLFELGRQDHQFRLRYKGQYLRDAYAIEDYGIVDNSIIKMVPLSKRADSMVDLSSLSEHSNPDLGPGQSEDVKEALLKEISIFKQRERLIFDFRGLLYLHFMGACLSFLTTYWYSGIWTFLIFLIGVYYCPTFTRTGGFIGKHSIYKFHFCIVYGILSLINMGLSLYFAAQEWIKITNHGCKDWMFVDDCSHQVVFSGVFFCLQALCLFISSIIAWVLLWNMKIEYGDYIERHLVQSRDIEDVMKAAKHGRMKEKRVAAFELATLAATGDDNKFRIVAEGGLDVLLRMTLSSDEATQEHAVEALAELLTVPSIQDEFVAMGGMRTLTAVLHSRSQRLMYEAAMAISYIVSDSEENKGPVVAHHGLDDLIHAAEHGTISVQRVIAGVFLELAFNSDIRAQMTFRNKPAKALISLCKSSDPDTQRFALQTLELLAIESSEMICAQEELLELLLELPMRTVDDKLFLLAAKILLYYAENRDTCENLLYHPNVRESLTNYARTKDPMLQKVIIKVIFCGMEDKLLRHKTEELNLASILKYIRDHAADREAWDMADQALQEMNSEESLNSLPTLSTAEKLNRMDDQAKANMLKRGYGGSKISLGSRTSLQSGNTESSGDVKKPFD